jgi:hypothetical protein
MCKINKNFLLFSSLSFFLFLAGCESVPPGTAPADSIVTFTSVSSQKPVQGKIAVNTMLTALITSPIISASDKTPTVFFRPSALNFTNKSKEYYSYTINNYALSVYKNLLYTNLVIAPISMDDYDYSLVSNYRENPIFSSVKKGKVYLWNLSLYSKSNKNEAVWSYSLNIIVNDPTHN